MENPNSLQKKLDSIKYAITGKSNVADSFKIYSEITTV